MSTEKKACLKVEKIKRISVAEKVAEEIIAMIQSGKFVEGQMLPTERDLAEMFGVGRSSIREALQALQSMGIIERRQGSGTYVSSRSEGSCFSIANILSRFTMIELSEARTTVEEQTAYLAAMNATEENIRAMYEANERLRSMVDSDDRSAIVACDQQVHRVIAEGANNSFLLEMLDMLWNVISEANIAVLTGDKVRQAVAFHDKIIKCISNSDPAGARQAMREHIRDVHNRIIEEYSCNSCK